MTESDVEQVALDLLAEQGYETAKGNLELERADLEEVLLLGRLQRVVQRLNPHVPGAAVSDAVAKVRQVISQAPLDLLAANQALHRYLIDGVPVVYHADRQYDDTLRLIDFTDLANNEFLAVSQFTIRAGRETKRPDILLFVNGIPLVLIELKNPTNAHATLDRAFNQVRTYREFLPGLFACNLFCVISDGHDAQAGTLTANRERYAAWKTADALREASHLLPQLQVLIMGMLNRQTMLELLRYFTTFETTTSKDKHGQIIQHTVKKLAAYHQYGAVKKAVARTVEASTRDRRAGVVWHTTGSGKSLSMVFYSAMLLRTAAMHNPTIVVITDRNDLDEQLFDTFTASRGLLGQTPLQAQNKGHLQELLRRSAGGVIFTTLQKFEGELCSDRTNIVVLADEAHRSHYGFDAKFEEKTAEFSYGYAHQLRQALPNATFLGFTGTPIETEDVSTKSVFGDYIDIYDIAQAVADGATVKIYYESRLAKVNLSEEGRQLIEAFDREHAENEDQTLKAKRQWTKLEAIVGHPQRIANLAQDIVQHFEQRRAAIDGKAMIVTMSRRIAADLYNAIVALRPDWHSDDLREGAIKVVMTTSSDDGPELARHRTSKEDREELGNRVRDVNDPLKLVIVRDMWLTGFDAPCLHTLYIDKPMRGHNLIQAIARVNRVFKDKPGGLVVDYLGIATDLKKALQFYSDAGGQGDPAEEQGQALDLMLEKLDVVRNFFLEKSANQLGIAMHEPLAYYGIARPESPAFNLKRFFEATPKERLNIMLQATEHILGIKDGKTRFLREVTLLSKAYALASPHEQALAHKEEIALYQALQARIEKLSSPSEPTSKNNLNLYSAAIKQIIDQSLESEEVLDVYQMAGMEKPEISILSDEFLSEVRNLRHKNLALALLKRLLNEQITTTQRSNIVKRKELLKMVEEAVKRYQNQLVSTAEVIQELIEVAKRVKEDSERANTLGLSPEELAFYDALRDNDTVRQVMEDDRLLFIAREVAEQVRKSTTLDWSRKHSARAQVVVAVRRVLKRWGYPPEKQEHAIDLVMKQAEVIAGEIGG